MISSDSITASSTNTNNCGSAFGAFGGKRSGESGTFTIMRTEAT